jgi:hypothetical protein
LHVAPDGESLDRAVDVLRQHGWALTRAERAAEGIEDEFPHRRVILHGAVAASGVFACWGYMVGSG